MHEKNWSQWSDKKCHGLNVLRLWFLKFNIEILLEIGFSGIIGPLQIRATKSYLVPGDNLEISCSTPNGSVPEDSTYQWKKINGNLPENFQIIGSKLKLNNLKISNRGIYRCSLTTPFETIFADYVIDLEG